MGYNKIIYGGRTLVDLTGDTVTAADLAEGKTAHDAKGEPITGTAAAGGGAKIATGQISGYKKGTITVSGLAFKPAAVFFRFKASGECFVSGAFRGAGSKNGMSIKVMEYWGDIYGETSSTSAAFTDDGVSMALVGNRPAATPGAVDWWAIG